MSTTKIAPKIRHDVGLITADDQYWFNEGTHFRLYERLGAHPMEVDGRLGTNFAVWAPNAERVHVMGDFNGWNRESHPMHSRASSGIWECWIPDVKPGAAYKYHIVSHHNGYQTERADPLAFFAETPPRTASVVWELDYEWSDQDWMQTRARANSLDAPIAVYEVHLGSWRRKPEEGNRPLTYRELAPLLAEYVVSMGYTHVEFLPVMEHPFYGSWGYQTLGYFAPTSRYGTPQDFMYLVDHLHQRGIGVILDWVPSHFPTDGHGLGYFDGTHLYEHADAREGFHPDWKSFIFNFGRNEVKSFLISSALFWLEKYHIDGLRVDAVASMLYRDYSRREGEWIPNEFGGRENIQAMDFLRKFNEEVFRHHPDVQTYAEESTAWPMVSRPTYIGGLGFGLKWDMGWMHDTLQYFSYDPVHRKYHHGELTFRMLYAFTENFILSLSHDEVVHGKGSMLRKMPGDYWQKFANLRLLHGYMYAQPGKKLLFMGTEIAQWEEWHHEGSIHWHLLQEPAHAAMAHWVRDLNRFYRETPCMYENDLSAEGFQWIDGSDAENSVICFMRKGKSGPPAVIVFNFTPVARRNYRLGVPESGVWKEVLNSDATEYGGSGQGNFGGVQTVPIRYHGMDSSVSLTLPPLGMLVLMHE